MTKLKGPFFSLGARGQLSKLFSAARRRGRHILESKPIPTDAQSSSQLFWRNMFSMCRDLWHDLSEAEKAQWERDATPRHMTGYAWYISQCLRPNPGIYLPLIGGTMQGIIDMDGIAIQDLLDPVNPQDADTEAARDAAIAAALAGSLHCDVYGYDGANWQTLLVESAAQKNLRVRLYAGANTIAEHHAITAISAAVYGLVVEAKLRSYSAAGWSNVGGSLLSADNLATSLRTVVASACLYGYDGTGWDRLRTYGVGVLKVGRAEIGLSTLRRVGVGQVKAAAGNLYWMNLNPSAGLSAFEMTDDLNGLGAVVLDHFDTTRDGHMITFDPPMEFTTGIYLKTLTNMTSITFGYK